MTPSNASRRPSPVAVRAPSSPSHLEQVRAAIAEVAALVPPVWPLEDYVAVNPFLGLAPARFLDARQLLRDVRECELLPPAATFQAAYDRGEITTADVEQAFLQCLETYPDLYTGGNPRRLAAAVATEAAARPARARHTLPRSDRRYHTAAEAVDSRLGSSWSSHIVTDISRHCGLHFDRGQAAWPSPWKHLALYEAWRESARISRRMELLGIAGFREFVDGLPVQPEQAVATLLGDLMVPPRHWRPFLMAEIFSVAGWASYLRYRLWQATLADGATIDEHVIGLLAIRLAYDGALAARHSSLAHAAGALFPAEGDFHDRPAPDDGVLGRHLFQVAAEIAYRRRLCGQLLDGPAAGSSRPGIAAGRRPAPEAHPAAEPAGSTVGPTPQAARKALQMVFCIDVRSEVFRRHLEAAGDSVQTFGFAGFFGIPLEFVPLGASHGPAQCPVLLKPAFRAEERVAGDDAACDRAAAARRVARLGRRAWKTFQTSATSCFSFVESLGLAYLPKLVTDSLGWTRPTGFAAGDGLSRRLRRRLGPDVTAGAQALPRDRCIDLAHGLLKNLGLVGDFARIVAICGHGSEMANNPYRASYDCGACGGHSGEPNARIAATLLNDPGVRQGLAERGIAIPADTWFVATVHVTTTDEVRFPDAVRIPESHRSDLEMVKRWLAAAGAATRLERAGRLSAEARFSSADGLAAVVAAEAATHASVIRRSRDWSEVRPELGLAGNAAFIIAPRSRTAGLDLGGRTFLHDYDHAHDPEGTVLELLMTAPMVVTSWINLQYYASAVDNRAFGSGNKLIHNVTGQLGVLLGNGGDLMTGLPWQSVSDGTTLRHEPLRLTVLIEAPRAAVETILHRHRGVGDLVGNGWLTLVVREGDAFFRWSAVHGWRWDRPWPPAA